MAKLHPGEVIPMDGKALRATRNGSSVTSALHLVSTWASQNGLVLRQVNVDKRYYLSSLQTNAAHMLQAIKQHWSIENNLHWRLDVNFNEDRCRTKFKNCPENLAIAHKIALAILMLTPTELVVLTKSLRLLGITIPHSAY